LIIWGTIMVKFDHSKWVWITIIIILIGFFLFLLLSYLTFEGGLENLSDFALKVGIEIALSLFTVGVVALILDHLLHKSLYELIDSLISPIGILKGASILGVEDIFARRDLATKIRFEERIILAIKTQLDQKGGFIKILCVAAPEFLRKDTDLDKIIRNGLNLQGNSCVIKALILSDQSTWADCRQKLEQPHPTINDIRSTIDNLKDLQSQYPNNINYRLYDDAPIVFLIITNDTLFLEPYPIHRVINGGALGGVTPILEIKKSSQSSQPFERWNAHFDHLWNNYNAQTGVSKYC